MYIVDAVKKQIQENSRIMNLCAENAIWKKSTKEINKKLHYLNSYHEKTK